MQFLATAGALPYYGEGDANFHDHLYLLDTLKAHTFNDDNDELGKMLRNFNKQSSIYRNDTI